MKIIMLWPCKCNGVHPISIRRSGLLLNSFEDLKTMYRMNVSISKSWTRASLHGTTMLKLIRRRWLLSCTRYWTSTRHGDMTLPRSHILMRRSGNYGSASSVSKRSTNWSKNAWLSQLWPLASVHGKQASSWNAMTRSSSMIKLFDAMLFLPLWGYLQPAERCGASWERQNRGISRSSSIKLIQARRHLKFYRDCASL